MGELNKDLKEYLLEIKGLTKKQKEKIKEVIDAVIGNH